MTFDFEVSTINAIKQFRDLLAEIKKKHPNMTMPMAREYLKRGTKIAGVSEELYADLDRLSQIRTTAITTEKEYIIAQAQKAHIKIPEEIVSGKSLVPFFEDAAYELVPTLKIFEYMTFYSPEEIAGMKEKIQINDEQENTDKNTDSER